MSPLFLIQRVFSTLGATCNKVMTYGDQSCGEYEKEGKKKTEKRE